MPRSRARAGFQLLSPLVRPNPKNPELLVAALETLACGLRECPTNQATLGLRASRHPSDWRGRMHA